MIITVTFNPAFDKTASVDHVSSGDLHRLREVRQDIGGKGINVSRTIAALDGKSLACGFAGGACGRRLIEILTEQGIPSDFCPLPGEMRTNLKLVEPKGVLTEFNEPGPEATPADVKALEKKLVDYAAPGVLFALGGNVGPGVSNEVYANLIAKLKAKGAYVLLDADGPLLEVALRAPVRPDIIKPNARELARFFNVQEQNIDRAVLSSLAGALRQSGITYVCISLGEQGAAFYSPEGNWFAPAVPVRVKSTVGAGDAMVAALALGWDRKMPAQDVFQFAVATATAACTTCGTQPADLPTVDSIKCRVELQTIY